MNVKCKKKMEKNVNGENILTNHEVHDVWIASQTRE